MANAREIEQNQRRRRIAQDQRMTELTNDRINRYGEKLGRAAHEYVHSQIEPDTSRLILAREVVAALEEGDTRQKVLGLAALLEAIEERSFRTSESVAKLRNPVIGG